MITHGRLGLPSGYVLGTPGHGTCRSIEQLFGERWYHQHKSWHQMGKNYAMFWSAVMNELSTTTRTNTTRWARPATILYPYYILYDYIHQSLLCIHIISPRRGCLSVYKPMKPPCSWDSGVFFPAITTDETQKWEYVIIFRDIMKFGNWPQLAKIAKWQAFRWALGMVWTRAFAFGFLCCGVGTWGDFPPAYSQSLGSTLV